MHALFHGTGFYSPGRMIGPALWPHHDIIILLEGQARLQIGGQEYSLSEGDAIVIPPQNGFEGEATTPAMTMWVLHFRDYPALAPESPFACSASPFIVGGAFGDQGDRGLLREFSQRWERRLATPGCERSLALLAQLIVTRAEEAILSPRKAESPRLRAAIEAGLAERAERAKGAEAPGDPVARMAAAAGLGASRFRQAFKDQYGVSPSRYLQQARMEEAKRLLATTLKPIKEIGQTVGYTEMAAFHRAFRRETQATPAAYRKRFGGMV